MNEDIIKGKWEQLKGEAQKRWGRLTNDELDEIDGERTRLLGRLRETYGIAEEEAEKQIKEWEKTIAA